MKRFLNFLLWVIILLGIATILLYVTGNEHIIRGIKTVYFTGHTTAFIDDSDYFENRTIRNETISEWPKHHEYNEFSTTSTLDSLNTELGTAAFLIIKNDSIWFERYYQGFNEFSRTNSFSVAKSITALLMYKAIQDGYLQNIDQPVADFFPQFDKRLSIGDLASMSSGLDWEENYFNPFGSTARAYFDDNIREQVLELEVEEEPGQEFKYLSGNFQLLGMVIEKATGQNLSGYLSESFWKPMGMNDNGLWQLDSRESGMEKAYCCIATNARNFSKFGKLVKDKGKWNEQQLLDAAYVEQAVNPRFEDAPYYGYGFWLFERDGKEVIYLRGILGQYVIVIPEDNLIITRLGKEFIRKDREEKHHEDFFIYIDEAYKMIENASKTQS